MENEEIKTASRKNFVTWGLGFVSMLAVGRFFSKSPKKQIVQTAKMLTQDGRLVEVDITNLGCGKGKKISEEELKTFVKKA